MTTIREKSEYSSPLDIHALSVIVITRTKKSC